MQGHVFFHEKSAGAINFDVAAGIEELLAIFGKFVKKKTEKRHLTPYDVIVTKFSLKNIFFVIYK